MQQVAGRLVESGLADDINMPYMADRRGGTVVETCHIDYASMLKDSPYTDIYDDQRDSRAYIGKLLDGALLQMTYEFTGRDLTRSRLAYLPSPRLLDYDSNPELYETDDIFAHVVEPRSPIIPMRFDYDNRPGVAQNRTHPTSHLTLGSFRHCRIAATAALGPWMFAEFILRSFYSRGLSLLNVPSPNDCHKEAASITPDEAAFVHIGVPASS